MDRRIKRCCADNPECKSTEIGGICYWKYTKFVNATDNPKEPPMKEYKRPRPSVIDTYKTPGLRVTHGDIMRC